MELANINIIKEACEEEYKNYPVRFRLKYY